MNLTHRNTYGIAPVITKHTTDLFVIDLMNGITVTVQRRGPRERPTDPRVYITHNSETVLDDLINRRSRPTTQYRELIERHVHPVIGATRLRWSQKAGCSCPCSPGFITSYPTPERSDTINTAFGGYVYHDIWVSVGPEMPSTEHPKEN